MRKSLLVRGHHGLGDNLHQRAVLRLLMRDHDVWLESSWVSLYHDLIAEGLHVRQGRTPLRTQIKNATREQHLFSKVRPPADAKPLALSYNGETVRQHGGVLAAMCACAGVDIAEADFRMPIPAEWRAKADRWLAKWRLPKPLMMYRPLVARKEWGGNVPRNPEPDFWIQLFNRARAPFSVVSVADLERGKEWMVGNPILADVACHQGELDFEVLAALFQQAALVWTAPGFGVILAQAVETPQVVVFGGYEDSRSFGAGARFSPWCPVDVIEPCQCFSHTHECRKAIDLPAAHEKIAAFIAGLPAKQQVAA